VKDLFLPGNDAPDELGFGCSSFSHLVDVQSLNNEIEPVSEDQSTPGVPANFYWSLQEEKGYREVGIKRTLCFRVTLIFLQSPDAASNAVELFEYYNV
jgi:hypothetical protein